MKKIKLNRLGWMLLLVMGISWIVFGYSAWFLLLTPMASFFFSVGNGNIKKLGKIKQMSFLHLIVIASIFILSVAIVYGLIVLASYVINDLLHLTGMVKTISIIIAIILSLYPVKFAFGSIVYKMTRNLKPEG